MVIQRHATTAAFLTWRFANSYPVSKC